MIDRVIEKLIQSGYREGHARDLGARLIASDAIRNPLLRWVETGEEIECSYEEISTHKLMSERGFKYPNALNIIAWLNSDPKEARKTLSARMNYFSRRSI